MPLFKSILQSLTPLPPERRTEQRFTINPAFPLKAVLSYVGRDETGKPMSESRTGWNWKGRLLDCSFAGARLQVGPGLNAIVGDACDLKLGVQEFEIAVPCHVAHIQEQAGEVIFGLEHDITDDATLAEYGQLIEVLALGSTLKARHDAPVPDKSGYLVEQFANDRPARLTVWREMTTRGVVAFEFLLKESVLQAAVGQSMEYLLVTDDASAVRATAQKSMEMHRLYTWVLPNLPADVPADVKAFLQGYA